MYKNLAVVIPFYKASYFETLLEALVAQTNQNFNVYIGNDCSPSNPYPMIKQYNGKLNIIYRNFDDRLGHISLTKQWDRCVEMVKDEEWVWVLPDDDVPSNNVVEEFYQALNLEKKYQIKVFRFPISLIDHNGNITKEMNYNDPVVETNLEFYQRVVRGKAVASLGDNIFHKRSLLENGGFVNFLKAWGSDHATILQVSAGGLIYFLSNARLYFRMSGENISSDSKDGVIKLNARIMFAKWLKKNECIFPQKPDQELYMKFYLKTEYYILNEWGFDVSIFGNLYKLRRICFDETAILPVGSVFWKKVIGMYLQ